MTAPILVILDRELKGAQPALAKGARLAAANQAPLRIVVNAYSSAMVRAVGLDNERLAAARRQIENAWQQRAAELLGSDEPPLTTLWEKDSAAGLRQMILAHQPSLVVVHTSDDSTLRRHLFTPRDWQLIRKAPCPVLCVHETPWPTTPRVLAALDPATNDSDDALSVAVLEAARNQARDLGADLAVCHVLDELDEGMVLLVGETLPDYGDSMEKIRAHYRDNFFRFGTSHGLNPEQMITLNGPVASTLANYCNDNPVDLLVVGTVHRSLPERLLLGATAEALITRASTDVLVIKPEGFQSPWLAD